MPGLPTVGIQVFDRAAGTTFDTQYNLLADVYAGAKAGIFSNHLPDATNPITIFLPGGEFELTPLELDTDYIHIQGAGADLTILTGDGTAGGATALLEQTCSFCDISKLTLSATAGIGFHQTGATNPQISEARDCIFFSAASAIGTARGLFTRCKVLAVEGIDATVPEVVFSDCAFYVGTMMDDPDGGLFKNCTSQIQETMIANAPVSLVKFIGHISDGGGPAFANAKNLRLINCVIGVDDGADIFDEIVDAAPEITIIGGRIAVAGSGRIFAARGANPTIFVAGQPQLVGGMLRQLAGGEVLKLQGVGRTLLRDDTAAGYDGDMVYDQTADEFIGGKASSSQTFDLTP